MSVPEPAAAFDSISSVAATRVAIFVESRTGKLDGSSRVSRVFRSPCGVLQCVCGEHHATTSARSYTHLSCCMSLQPPWAFCHGSRPSVSDTVMMYCQKCRTPLKLDDSLDNLNPAAFDLLIGMRRTTPKVPMRLITQAQRASHFRMADLHSSPTRASGKPSTTKRLRCTTHQCSSGLFHRLKIMNLKRTVTCRGRTCHSSRSRSHK